MTRGKVFEVGCSKAIFIIAHPVILDAPKTSALVSGEFAISVDVLDVIMFGNGDNSPI